jgi:hypothetical protein
MTSRAIFGATKKMCRCWGGGSAEALGSSNDSSTARGPF